jgi:hypothetical protein
VGSNGEDPRTAVGGADGCRWKHVPLDIEPERGQVPENFSPDGSIVESKEVRHVLHDDVSGSKLANGSGHLAPQNGFGVSETGELSERADALAGEASGDNVNRLSGSGSDRSHVVKDGHSGPTLLEDRSPPGVALAEPAVLKPGEMEAEGEQPDPIEDASNGQHRPVPQ